MGLRVSYFSLPTALPRYNNKDPSKHKPSVARLMLRAALPWLPTAFRLKAQGSSQMCLHLLLQPSSVHSPSTHVSWTRLPLCLLGTCPIFIFLNSVLGTSHAWCPHLLYSPSLSLSPSFPHLTWDWEKAASCGCGRQPSCSPCLVPFHIFWAWGVEDIIRWRLWVKNCNFLCMFLYGCKMHCKLTN